MALTHRELCQIAYKFLKRNGFKVCFHDRFIAVTSTGEQPDAMGFRNSASCLIEAKCSRADLLADRKSVFVKIRLLEWATGDSLLVSRELFQLRIYHLAGDYFTLLTEEYGKYMGGPRVIAVGVILTISHLLEISECDYMLSALRRMELRGHLNEIYDGVIVNKKEGNAA